MQNLKSISEKSSSPKSLSNEALLRITQTLVAEERRLTTEILWHLHEIQVRRLYLEKGYASLFEYAVKVLGYSEAAAGRRIAAMKLLVDVPEIEPALKKGEVSLSTLSTIQSFIQRKNAQGKSNPVSYAEKRELVLSLQGKSRRECEKFLVELDPLAALPKERERILSSTQTEIRFIADDEPMRKLQKIKNLDSHVQSHPTYLELFHRMADLVLKKLDPLEKAPSKTNLETVSAAVSSAAPPAESPLISAPMEQKRAVHPRFIPVAVKRAVWMRDQAQCSFKSADGKRCSSRFALQIDHKIPVAWGGKGEFSNLQLLCGEHNRRKAVLQLGGAVMQPYLKPFG